MIFSGQQFREIPAVNQLSFIFSETYLTSGGSASIGFSGVSGNFNYTFSNGTIYSPQGKSIYKYNIGQSINISGFYNNKVYGYYINNNLVENNANSLPNQFNGFIVNTTGTNLISNVYLQTNPISLSLQNNNAFISQSGLNGSIVNNSNVNNIIIYNSNLYFNNSDIPLLSGQSPISGIISGNSNLNFFLQDVDAQLYNLPVSLVMTLYTNIGTYSTNLNLSKVSGLANVTNTLSSNNSNVNIPVLFFGSGLVNQFVYVPPIGASTLFTYTNFARNLSGQRIPKTVNFALNPISPLNSGFYLSQYITGIQMTNSGEYLFCPQVQFTGYYAVTGLNWNSQSLLLSSGCTGNIPVNFSSLNGVGANASGYISLFPIVLSGIYGNGVNSFNIVNNLNFYNNGTGYNIPPKANLLTGTYQNCYDMATLSGAQSIFLPFNYVGLLSPLASYFTGETVCVTGLVNNNTQTGYKVSGILIDNIGSGYNSTNYVPKFSFIRTGGDNLTKNATGMALMKNSGLYLFNNNWGLLTGISSYGLSQYSGTTLFPSGQISLGSYQDYITFQILYSGLDSTQQEVIQLTVCNSTGECFNNLISGTQYYNISQYFLKKKVLGNIVNYQTNNPLSFLLTQSQLDQLYNSNMYSQNTTLNIGNLDF